MPWNECSVCWGADDKRHLLRCTHCNDAYHIYCLEPPLEEVRCPTLTHSSLPTLALALQSSVDSHCNDASLVM